jgi:hypothetical protein
MIEGVPVEVKFGTRTDTLFVHPDGVIVGNSTKLQLQFEQATRARNRVEQIRKKLAGGEFSRDQWEEAQRKLDEQLEEGMSKLDARLTNSEISQKEFDDTKKANELFYRKQVDFLLNQRDGEPVSLEENDKLQLEVEGWEQRASFKPFAVPMLKSCLLDWTVEAAGEDGRGNGEPLGLTFDSLQSLPEDWIIVAFIAVNNYYKEDEEKEKKHTEKPADSLLMSKPDKDTSLTISGSTELPELTGSDLRKLGNGENASLNAP